LHKLPAKLDLPDIFSPGGNAFAKRVVFAHQVKPVAPIVDVVLALGSLGLRAELGEPDAQSTSVLALLENSNSLVEALDAESPVDPLVVVGAQRLPVEHVAHPLQLAGLHAARPDDLLLANSFLLAELVAQVLVIIHDVLSHDHHLHVDALVGTLLPLHEGPVEAALVLLNQSQLHSIHVVAVVLAVLLPKHQGLVLDIAVLEVALAESVILGLRGGLLCQALSFVL